MNNGLRKTVDLSYPLSGEGIVASLLKGTFFNPFASSLVVQTLMIFVFDLS